MTSVTRKHSSGAAPSNRAHSSYRTTPVSPQASAALISGTTETGREPSVTRSRRSSRSASRAARPSSIAGASVSHMRILGCRWESKRGRSPSASYIERMTATTSSTAVGAGSVTGVLLVLGAAQRGRGDEGGAQRREAHGAQPERGHVEGLEVDAGGARADLLPQSGADLDGEGLPGPAEVADDLEAGVRGVDLGNFLEEGGTELGRPAGVSFEALGGGAGGDGQVEVQADVDDDPAGPPQLGEDHAEQVAVVVEQADLLGELLGVVRPALGVAVHVAQQA